MFKYGPKNSTKIRPGDSAATMADKLDAQARELHMKASMLRLRGEDALGPRLQRERILTREEVERLGGLMEGLASMANDKPPVVYLPAIPGGDTESDT